MKIWNRGWLFWNRTDNGDGESQPWGIAQDLLMGFFCEAEGDAVIRMDPGVEGKSVSLSNTNKMLHPENQYYNEAVAGVKTGTTSRAGNCLVSVFSIGEERLLCIVMNSRYYGKFTDTQTLYDMRAAAMP